MGRRARFDCRMRNVRERGGGKRVIWEGKDERGIEWVGGGQVHVGLNWIMIFLIGGLLWQAARKELSVKCGDALGGWDMWAYHETYFFLKRS